MTRLIRKTPVELFGEEVLLSDLTADITVRSETEALTIADDNGWDDLDLIARACALSYAISKDGETVFDSGVAVLTTLTETEVRRLYALAQGRASDISVSEEDEQEAYSESYMQSIPDAKSETVERFFTISGAYGKEKTVLADDAFESLGEFSEKSSFAGSVRDECEKISEFICRDARRYDGELSV